MVVFEVRNATALRGLVVFVSLLALLLVVPGVSNAADNVGPAPVKSLTATGSTTRIYLNWADNSERDLAGYHVYRSERSDGGFRRLTSVLRKISDYPDLTAPAGLRSYYRVVAVDRSGNASRIVSISAIRRDTTRPATPIGLTAARTESGALLTWVPNTEPDLSLYRLTRATTPAGPFTWVARLDRGATSYLDTAAAAGTGYYYRLVAVDLSGNASAPATATLVAPDLTPPAPVSSLTATGTVADVTLDWADSTEADLAGYRVYRADASDGPFSPIGDGLVTASGYQDTTALPRTPYWYRVTAVDLAGNESEPVTVEGTRLVGYDPIPGADLTVAPDGSGDMLTIAEALAAATGTEPFVIGIRPGTYPESFTITRPNLTLLGAGAAPGDVVITDDKSAGTLKPDGTPYGTTGSATVTVRANDVTARNLTIENAYVETGTGNEQAVALKTQGDRLVFDAVRLLGDQDTLYADSPAPGVLARSYYVNSYVEGDVDFVFGRGTAVFDRSTLFASTRQNPSNNGYLTAASTDISLPYGFLITDSTVLSDAPPKSFHLGRPWQPSGDPSAIAQVVIRDTVLPEAIKDAPWTDMTSTFSWRDARLFEYRNSGPGAGINPDRPQLTDAQALRYTKWTYLAGSDGWNPTGQEPPADITAPAAPTGLGATPGDSTVTLAWDAVTEPDLAGYHVYRDTGTIGEVELTMANRLTDALVTETGFVDRTAANGTTYRYVVTASDRTGNESPASTIVTAAPTGVPLPPHDILVAADGTGQFTSVQAALAAAPAGTAGDPTVIAIKPGFYRELITVNRNYITLIGTSGTASEIVLSYDNAAGTPNPDGTGPYGTGRSQSVLISGSNVTVRDLTIENAFDEAAHDYSSEQAVALKTTGDRLVFDNVRLLGNQDTLLADSPSPGRVARAYYVDCYVEGDVDFIFGRGTAVFDASQIHALSRGSSSNNGYITAASTADTNPHGFLIVDSTITSNAPAGTFSLGRPWRGWSDGYTEGGVVHNSRGQVTIRDTALPDAIRVAQPWADMAPNVWTDGRFFEYRNTGPGATINDNRPQLSPEQALEATPAGYLAGTDGWNPAG